MRVRKLHEDNQKKLRKLIWYIKRMTKFPLIMCAERVNVLKWWVNASYAYPNNMWGHIGETNSMVTYGRGSIISIPKKQNINTKSLIEA